MKKNSLLHTVLNPVFAAIFLIVLFILTAIHLNTAYDESLWMYIGNLWNNKGVPPYIGAVENKTPGIFVLYAISDYIASGNIFLVRSVGVLATLLTAFLIYRITTRIHNKTTGVITLYVFGLISCWDSMDGFAFAHTEVFMILFTTLSFYFLIKSINLEKNLKWLLFSGISMGMAIAFKQIAITTTFGLLIVFLILNKKSFKTQFRGAFIISLGIILSTFLSYLVLFVYDVSFSDYIEGAWLILFNSGSSIDSINEHFGNFFDAFIFSRLVLFYPLITWFLLKKSILNHSFKIVLVLWLLFDFIGVNASGYYFGHQIKQLLPVFSIIVGISMYSFLTEMFKVNSEQVHTKTVLIILMTGIICFPYKQMYSNAKLVYNYDSTYIAPHIEIANWIQENSKNDNYIYIIGGEANLIRTQAIVERMSSSKYFQSIFLTSDYEREILLKDLKENPPAFILRDQFIDNKILNKYGNTILTFVDKNYELVKTMHQVEILKLK